MKVIIIGAGQAGIKLARKLSEERNNVVLIDRDQNALDEAQNQLDVMTLRADGALPSVLQSVNREPPADMIAALSNSDESNLLACMFANHLGIPISVARLSNSDFRDDTEIKLEEMGISLAVNEDEVTAVEMFNVTKIPNAFEVVNLLEGRLQVVGFRIPSESPLLRCNLMEYPNQELLKKVRILAYQDRKKVIIPTGKTRFQIHTGLIYVAGTSENLAEFFQEICPSDPPPKRVVISGCGDLGLPYARMLSESKPKIDIVIIEQNKERAEEVSEILEGCLVLQGDCLDGVTMQEANIGEHTVFAATTGDDEKNIMSCIMAERMGASYTMAKISNPHYDPLIKNSLIDRGVNPHSAIINEIYHFARGKNVKHDTQLVGMEGELLEISLSEGHPWIGKMVGELELTRRTGTIVTAIAKQEVVQVVLADSVFEIGDTLLVYALPEAVKKLKRIFG